MPAIDLWKLATEYSVCHAALLIAGHSPDEAERYSSYDLRTACPGYHAANTVLCSAIAAGTLSPIKTFNEYDDYGNDLGLDTRLTLVSIAELDRFMRSRGHVCEFFEPRVAPTDGAMGPGDAYFSKKLYAANAAWNAVTKDPTRMRGKSPKQALQEWLIEHAGELGLLNREGQPNRTGIEEICKVANWKPEGGATPTPSPSTAMAVLPTAQPLIRLPVPSQPETTGPREDFSADLDDEIPF